MTGDAYIVRPDGSITPTAPADGAQFTLKETQQIVGGLIDVLYIPEDRLMVVHDEGRLDGSERNAIASAALGPYADIYGTVLICPRDSMS